MASYTLPTAGNHQRDYIAEYQDYWHQRPLWSTTTLDGVRIYNLTSECKANGGCLGHRSAGAVAPAADGGEHRAVRRSPCGTARW